MPTPNRTELRSFILERFNRNEFGLLCNDYFPDFYRDYDGVDTPLTKLAEALVAHCERRDQLENLRSAVHAARPQPYEATFGEFIAAEIKTKPRNPRQIFLSYSHKDEALARTLATELRNAGLAVWIAADEIQPGEKWLAAIERGLVESGLFIVLLTPNSATSKWVRHEIEVAIQENIDGEMHIFPLKMAACNERDFSRFLRTHQFIDAVSDYEQGLQKLFDRLGIVDPQADVRRLKAEVVSLQSQLAEMRKRHDDCVIETKRLASKLQTTQQQLTQKEAELNAQTASLANATADAAVLKQRIETLTKDNQALQQALDEALAKLKTLTTPAPSKPTPSPNQKVKDRHTLTLAEGVTLELVRVPAGEFLYGDEKKKCTLPEYWIGKTPVTVSQFQAFLNTKPNFTPDSYWKSNVKLQQTEHPAKCVSWEEAKLFCEWVSKLCGVVVTLPTEMQWEKSARGIDGREYPWGNTKPDDTLCNFNKHDAYMKASGDDNYKFTTVVGRYSPKGDSPYGCVDMAGNVWEWCEDVYEGQSNARVLRGGSFYNHDNVVRCAYRRYYSIASHDNNYGFRVCVPHLSNL